MAICRKSWHFTLWLRPYALRGPLERGEGVPPGPSGQVRGVNQAVWLSGRRQGRGSLGE